MYSQLKVILRLHEVGARILGDIDEQTFDGGVEIVGMDGTQKHTLVPLGQNRFFPSPFQIGSQVPLICQKKKKEVKKYWVSWSYNTSN